MADPWPLRFATAPVNWNNSDLPGWREHVPFPEILNEMLKAGFHVTEYDAALGSDLEAISMEMVKRSMTFCGAYFWIDTQDPAAFERDLAGVIARCSLLQRIGCPNLIVSDKLRPLRVASAGSIPVDGSLSLDSDGHAAMISRLAQIAATSRAFDIAVHYHNHAGTFIETPMEVEALVAGLAGSGVDLCFDTGHYVFGGGDASQFIENHGDAIGYLHLKDVDPEVLSLTRSTGWGLLEALRHFVFPPLGQGSVGVDAILPSLVRAQYDGYVVIEQDTCPSDPTETARANLEYALASSRAQATSTSHPEQAQ